MAAYKVKLTTRAKPVKAKGRTILAIEPEDYTKEQVKALRAAGYTVLGYLSIGSVSNERPYYKRLEPYRLSRFLSHLSSKSLYFKYKVVLKDQ